MPTYQPSKQASKQAYTPLALCDWFRAAPRHPASPSRTRNKFRVRSPLFLGSAVSSNAEWYIGHALVELLEQERMVSLFSVIDILERRLQDGNSSRDEFMDILEAIEKLRRYA